MNNMILYTYTILYLNIIQYIMHTYVRIYIYIYYMLICMNM